MQVEAGKMLPDWRVSYCMRRIKSGKSLGSTGLDVKLMYSDKVKRSHYKNLMTCGSVWVCPVCNAKIMTKRSLELKRGLENKVYMALVTFTIQHNKSDKLEKLLEDLTGAIRYSKQSGKYIKKMNLEFGILGNIQALEIRYSKKTGWHPHKHAVYLLEKPVDMVQLKQRLLKRYRTYLIKRSYLVNEFTIDVRNTSVSEYITKWGLEMELTGGL